MTIDLNDARRAAAQLERLQQAASMLPALEAQAARDESAARLEGLRVTTRQELTALYSEYKQAHDEYKTAFSNAYSALETCAKSLKRLFDLRKNIDRKAATYVSERLRHEFEHGHADPFKDGLTLESQAQNEILGGFPLDLQLVPTNGNALIDAVLQLVRRFLG